MSRAVGDRGAQAFSAQTRLLWDACPGPEDLRLALRKAVLQPVRGIPGLAGDGGRTASRAGRPFGSSRGFAERAAAIGGGGHSAGQIPTLPLDYWVRRAVDDIYFREATTEPHGDENSEIADDATTE